MALFKGTRQEFDRYIGPLVRNIIQQISRRHKQEIGCCEHCGASGVQLDAAHRHGCERPVLIDKALMDFTSGKVITADLSLVDSKIRDLHNPIEDVILVLCKECHKRYDAEENKNRSLNTLPIKLSPVDVEVFKARLLKKKRAEITIHYIDGRQDVKYWNVKSFKPGSDVMNNLRSRPEFRNGNWQDKAIEKVCVSV